MSPALLIVAAAAGAWCLWARAPAAAARLGPLALRVALVSLVVIGGIGSSLAVGYNAGAWPGAGALLAQALSVPLGALAFAGTALLLLRGAGVAGALRIPEGRGAGRWTALDLVVALGLVVTGVLVRLPWLDAHGYGGDVLMYAGWGAAVAREGLAGAYASQDITHGPMFVGATGLMATLWQRLSPFLGREGGVPVSWIKVPGLVADTALGLLLFASARASWRLPGAAGVGLLFLLNPGVVLDSAWWGQTDSQAALWSTAAVVSASSGWAAPSGATGALALLTKLQAYFVAPLVALAAWRQRRWKGLFAAGAGAVLAVLVAGAPLLLSAAPGRLLAVYTGLVGRHPLVNVGAFNFWWLGLGWDGYATLDSALLWGGALPLSLRQAGMVVLAGYSALVLWRLWTRFDARELPLAAAALAMAFFMLPTQIHSRYLYPVLPLLLLASVRRPALLVAYLALSVTFFVNQLHLIWRTPGGWPEVLPSPPALLRLDAMGLTAEALALLNVAVFGALTWIVLHPLWAAPALSGATARPNAPLRRWPAWAGWTAGLVAVCVAGALVLWPWLDPRYSFYGPLDAHNHVMRVYFLDHLLRQGALFPRWWPDLALGYGYPLFTYYPPGAYFVAGAMHLAGATLYRSVQLLGALAVALGAGGSFVLGAWLFGRVSAAVALSCAFVLAPYPFLTTLYGDGTLPQALGLGLLPWLLAFAWRATQRPGSRYVLGLGATLAVLLLTHSLTALLGAGMLVPWIAGATLGLAPAERRAGAGRALGGVALGLAVSAFVWLPALLEQGAVRVELGQLPYLRFERSLWPFPLDLRWTFPAPRSGSSESPRASVAQVALLCAGAGVWAAGILRRRSAGRAGTGAVSAAVLVAATTWLLNGTWSRPVWETVPLLASVQFAWRLWGPFSLAVAVAGASLFAAAPGARYWRWALGGLLTGLVALNALTLRPPPPAPASAPPASPAGARAREDEGTTLVALAGTTSTGEFLPRAVVFDAPVDTYQGSREAYEGPFPSGGWIAGRVWPYSGEVRVRQVRDAPARTVAEVQVAGSAPAEVAFHTLAFPGWRVYVDGRRAPYRTPPVDRATRLGHGFVVVDVPPGAHTVELALGSTLWRSVGAVVSIAGLGAAVAFFCRSVVSGVLATRLLVAVAALSLLAAAVRVGGDLSALRAPPWPWPGTGRGAAPVIALDFAAVATPAGPRRTALALSGGESGATAGHGFQEIGGHRRHWLAMPLPAEASAAVLVPPRAVFQAGLGVDPGAGAEPEGVAVRFTLEVVDGAGGREVLLDEVLLPQGRDAIPGWRFAQVDLGAHAGQRVTLVLRTEGSGGGAGPRAGWADAYVYVDRSARYPPPTVVAPALPVAGGASATGLSDRPRQNPAG